MLRGAQSQVLSLDFSGFDKNLEEIPAVDWAHIHLDAVERRIRADGSLNTGHFVSQLTQHFHILKIIRHQP